MLVILAALLGVSHPNLKAQPAAEFLKDKRKGCLVANDLGMPVDSVSWNGPCSKGYAQGQGKLLWYKDGQKIASYNGQMQQGTQRGKGSYDIPGYAVMTGEFEQGMLHGQGIMRMPSGSKLQGHFEHGQFLNLDAAYRARLRKITMPGRDAGSIYAGDGESDTLFYYALQPKGKPRAVLALFPSSWESVENVISCNRALLQQASDKGMLCVVLSANFNKSLDIDTSALQFFNHVFADVISRFGVAEDRFILSGLSLGGENVLEYTELSRSPSGGTRIRPLAVIGVDPPVDMADLYQGAKTEIALYMRDTSRFTPGRRQALEEDRLLIDYFHQVYGGSPEQVPERYAAGSPFTRSHDDGGNARFLIDVPVRLYCDPDILWQMKNRSRDYYHMNSANLSAMINFLQLNGNTQAELIPALGKGFRVDGTRHPHSWSIVDATECLQWIEGLLQ